MSNENISENKPRLAKINRFLRIGVLVNFIIVIPFVILSVLAIGGDVIFILTVIFVSILCVLFLVLVIVDIYRMYKAKKSRDDNV